MFRPVKPLNAQNVVLRLLRLESNNTFQNQEERRKNYRRGEGTTITSKKLHPLNLNASVTLGRTDF
jgi:hypothetical protein